MEKIRSIFFIKKRNSLNRQQVTLYVLECPLNSVVFVNVNIISSQDIKKQESRLVFWDQQISFERNGLRFVLVRKTDAMKLEIKEPCHEDWNKMKIGMISRHCDSCDKSVMDFTKMHRAEIITYILSNPNNNVCGRMTRDQFDFHHEDIPVLIETLHKTNNPNPFLIMALVCLSLSACAQEQPNGKIKTPPAIEHTLGEIETQPIVEDTLKPQTNTIKVPLKGKVACEPVREIGNVEPIMVGDIEPVVQGGIRVEEPLETVVEERKVFQFAEKMPEFKGGMDAMFKYIQTNLEYPKYEKDKGIQGNVYVRFVVEKDGRITQPEIMKSVDGSKNLDKEVLRIINSMPLWSPGENNGTKVSVYMTLPFQFKLK